MGIFDDEQDSAKAEKLIAELRKELLDSQKKTKSVEAERLGLHSSDPPRTFAQWMKYKRTVGGQVYRSMKVQRQLERDFELLGRERFFGED